jgi:hypothetical protein
MTVDDEWGNRRTWGTAEANKQAAQAAGHAVRIDAGHQIDVGRPFAEIEIRRNGTVLPIDPQRLIDDSQAHNPLLWQDVPESSHRFGAGP